MIRLLRAEWIKLHTVTMNWVLGIVAVAFPVVIVLLTMALSEEVPDSRELVEAVTGASMVTIMLSAVIAAAGITGEFGFGTIRPTFAASPRRWRVIGTKGVVAVATAVVLETAILAVCLVGGTLIADRRGEPIDFGDVPEATAAVIGCIVLAALMALAAYGIGMILRSTPAAVSAFLLWPLIGEGLVGGLLTLTGWEDAPSWMPFQAGFRLAIAFDDGPGPSRLAGGIEFGLVAALLVGLGGWLVNRRDA